MAELLVAERRTPRAYIGNYHSWISRDDVEPATFWRDQRAGDEFRGTGIDENSRPYRRFRDGRKEQAG